MQLDSSEVLDRQLMKRLADGDEEAFRGLFARYAPTAQALAARIVRRSNLAEEIVQEAFLALWKNPQAYDRHRGSVRAWLMGMVHHRAVDLVRREESQSRRAEAAVELVEPAATDPADEIAERVDAPGERRAVRAALDELPEEQRGVIELMYFDGLSQSTIAERTGLPLGTVKSRCLLGMRRLRSALQGMER